jgi:hypothetical protein
MQPHSPLCTAFESAPRCEGRIPSCCSGHCHCHPPRVVGEAVNHWRLHIPVLISSTSVLLSSKVPICAAVADMYVLVPEPIKAPMYHIGAVTGTGNLQKSLYLSSTEELCACDKDVRALHL